MTTHSKHFCNSHKQHTRQKLQNSLLLQPSVTFIFVLFFSFSFAQQSKTDSLLALLKKDKEDTNKVNHLNALGWELMNTKPDTSLILGNHALSISEKTISKKHIADSYHLVGWSNYIIGNYDSSLESNFKALKLREELFDKSGIAKSLSNIGSVYYSKADYLQALDYYFKAVKMAEGTGDKKGIAKSFNNIGNVYNAQADYPKALDYYFKALKTFEELGDKNGIVIPLGNIGNIYGKQGDYPKALDYFSRALIMSEELGDKNRIATWLGNIGLIYDFQSDYPRALDYFFRALRIAEELGFKHLQVNILGNIGLAYTNEGKIEKSKVKMDALFNKALNHYFKAFSMSEELEDKSGMARNLSNIGSVYTYQKKYKEAEDHLLKALEMYKEIGAKDKERQNEELLSQLYDITGRYKLALEHYKKAIVLKDTIFSEENKKQLVRKEMNFEFEKKVAVANAEHQKELEKQQAVAEEKNRKAKIIIYSVIFGLLLVVVFASFIFRSLRITRKQKQIIELKNKETEEQKQIIEEKQKEITDSITYALRIQKAILPHRNEIWKALPESFVLYKPKDIVAGDFYWFHKNNESVLIAAADCTGHGVPGAFTSMICSEKLNEAVKHSTNPGEILSLVNKGIKVSLKHTEETSAIMTKVKDGMDVALCSIDIKSGIVKYAGANRPLWIIRNGQATVEEIKATKAAIGGDTPNDQVFKTHTIQLQKGDTIYLSSDGYADQDGGDKGKKLMTKTFKQMLLDIQDKSMNEQKEYLGNFIENWHADRHQLDDILVIGVRI